MDLVFLHGPAASGKLTIARALEARVGFPVFHNHLVVDLLTTVFTFGSDPFVRLREQFWTSVFADAARVDRSISFTFTPEATVRPGFAGRVRQLIEGEGGRVCFVRLRVSDGEQERRIGLPGRSEFPQAYERRDATAAPELRAGRRGAAGRPGDRYGQQR